MSFEEETWKAEPLPASLVDAVRPASAILGYMGEFILKEEDLRDIEDAEFLIENMIIKGHITVIAGKAGSGKTLIATDAAKQLSQQGLQVMYTNMDCSAEDAKSYHNHARQHGYDILCPHFHGKKGLSAWTNRLSEMAESDKDFQDTVLFIDTLKKIADLMNKNAVKELFTTLRALTAKGLTVVCLAHCNKNLSADGKLVFEGVGDVESDCDDLLYLLSQTQNQIQTITLEPSDKVRGIFYPISWEHDRDTRKLKSIPAQDIRAIQAAKDKLEKDKDIVQAIEQILKECVCLNQKTLVDKVTKLLSENESLAVGDRKIIQVLQRYRRDLKADEKPAFAKWTSRQTGANNAIEYRLEEGSVVQ